VVLAPLPTAPEPGDNEAMTDELRAQAARLRPSLLAAARGLAIGLLAVTTNPVLFGLTLLSLVLIPVLGLGFAVFPLVTDLVRMRANLTRRLATWTGVPISRPYRPVPRDAGYGTWRRFQHAVSDPATWRDFAWLVPGGLLGASAGLLAFALPAYGIEGVLLVPVVLYLTIDWYGYGVFWPIHNIFQALACVPQGLLLLVAGLAGARWLVWLDARFAGFFLGPTRSAALTHRVEHLTATRTQSLDAHTAELRRIERDLHDGTQARLVALSMNIGLAEELVKRDPSAAAALLAEARESSSLALTELRHLVRGIHPPVLAERGLDGAIRALALTVPFQVYVDIELPGRPHSPVESATYFAVAEALANMSKHSGARYGWVTVRYVDRRIRVEVGDDGAGGANVTAGGGLQGVEDRLRVFDGIMRVSSPPGGPTIVTMELPCELSSPKTSPSSGTA
jgi:signal transduction histidine kinase